MHCRHRHHPNHPWGPHFEENPSNVTIREGQNSHLDCKVGLIEDKLVSWVRRKSDHLDLLTLGPTNHSSDPRFLSDFKYPNNWRLAVRNASKDMTGTYLCQISTHPPKSLEVQLTVEAPEVFIVVNSRGERIHDVHYKTLILVFFIGGFHAAARLYRNVHGLVCGFTVNNLKSRSVSWFRNSDLLNHDVSRGGVSIKTEMNTDQESAKSVLNVARITRKDIGSYLCSAPPHNASVTVHILNGENPAELYHNHAMTYFVWSWKCFLLIFVLWVSK
ncbi:Opioid-binding protein/cell adhesion molecule [Folsomia candida]|uniref:Opioid-binding protein/cell adhesion molecule n=1 Tax=Folsomia candida TaxID=158441 RepID=A0A226F303_FOLCA|nr:Opioid-binding protein/cell adhesion molecule [Folsomia candida]